MTEPMTALKYLEKLRGKQPPPAVGRLEAAIQALDRPARARGPTMIVPITVPPSMTTVPLMPADYSRRAFTILAPGAPLSFGPVIPGYTFTQLTAFTVTTPALSNWFKEEDLGALIWLPWVCLSGGLGSNVTVFQELYLT